MIVNKVITGFVVQRYDTEAKRFLDQEFISGDDIEWEHEDEPCEPPVGPDGQEPSLNMEMVQPLTVENFVKALNTPPLLASPLSFFVGEQVEVIPTGDKNDLIQHEFIGTVVGIKNGQYVIVKDQEDNHFDCEPSQVHHLTA